MTLSRNLTLTLLLGATGLTAQNATLIKDLTPGATNTGPLFSEPARVGDKVIFDSASGLGVTDGTPAGTMLLNSNLTDVEQLITYRGRAYFRGLTAAHGSELWTSDGTRAGTRRLTDIYAGSAGSDLWDLCGCEGRIYFSVAAQGTRRDLYAYEGGAATKIWGVLNPTGMRAIGPVVAFSAQTAQGRELFVMHRSLKNPVIVKDIKPGSASSDPRDLTVVGHRLFFTAGTSAGRELMVSDLSPAGTPTTPVHDINPGAAASLPQQLTVWGDKVLFTATEPTHGRELWISDGTSQGTQRLTDVAAGSYDSFRHNDFRGAAAGDKFVFHVGNLLYVTDGTRQGTLRLGGGYPGAFLSVGSRHAYFRSSDTRGAGLWRTDGTKAGTVRIGNAGNTNPAFGVLSMTLLKDQLLMNAHDPQLGYEPHVLDLGAVTQTVHKSCTGATLTVDDPKLGATIKIAGQGVPNNMMAYLVVGRPLSQPLAIGPCGFWVDPTLSIIVPVTVINGAWQVIYTIPNDSKLDGGRAWAQLVYGDASGFHGSSDVAEMTMGR